MRLLLKIIGVLLSLVVLSIVVALLLSDQMYRNIAEKVVSKYTGREFSIEQLVTNRSLSPSIELKGVTLTNSDWGNQPNMFSVERLYINADLRSMLSKPFRINTILVDRPNFNLEKNQQGIGNWQFSDKEKDKKSPDFTRFKIVQMTLNKGVIMFNNRQTGKKQNIEIDHINLSGSPDNWEQKLKGKGAANLAPFSVEGNTGGSSLPSAKGGYPFDLNFTLGNNKIHTSGDIKPAKNTLQLEGDLSLHIESLSDLSVLSMYPILSKYDLPKIGPIEISSHLSGDLSKLLKTGLDLKDARVDINDPLISLHATGQTNRQASQRKSNLQLDLEMDDITKLSELFPIKTLLPGSLKLRAQINGVDGDYTLELDQMVIDSDGISVDAKGRITDILDTLAADIDLSSQSEDLEFINSLFGVKMPPQWGPVNASARITGTKKHYALENIAAEMTGNSTLKATGSIEMLYPFNHMQLDVDGSLATLKEISAFTRSPLPDIGPMKITGKIKWQEGRLSLTGAQASYNGEYGKAQVTGEIGNLIKFDQVNLKANANSPNLEIVKIFSGMKMPKVGAIQASADLISPSALDLSAKNLVANYNHNGIIIKTTGSIDSIIKKRADLDLHVQGQASSLSSLNSLLKSKLPAFGPISASATISGATQDIQVNSIKVSVNDNTLMGTITGDLGKVVNFKGIDLKTELSTPSIQQLLGRMNIKSKIIKPARLSSQIQYLDHSLHFRSSELEVADNKIIGDVSMLNYFDSTKRPKLAGNINILNFNLLDFKDKNKVQISKSDNTGDEKASVYNLPNTSGKNSDSTNRSNNNSNRTKVRKVLSSSPLPFNFIKKNDLDLKIIFGRFRGNLFDINNAQVTAVSNDGVFTLGPFKGEIGGGQTNILLSVNAKINPPLTSIIANVDSFDLAQAWEFRDSGLVQSSSNAFLTVDLRGEGNSLASIMSTANGSGSLYFENLSVKKGALRVFSSDIFRQTLDAINPFKKEPKDTQILCSASVFNVENGQLTTPYGLAAEANDFSVIGNGQINFKNEEIDMEFKTKPKKGFGLSLGGMLTGLVMVQGNIGSPQVTLNPKGIIEIGATVSAALATVGTSLLAQGLYDRYKANSKLCAKALGK